jgi:hypothetical protein
LCFILGLCFFNFSQRILILAFLLGLCLVLASCCFCVLALLSLDYGGLLFEINFKNLSGGNIVEKQKLQLFARLFKVMLSRPFRTLQLSAWTVNLAKAIFIAVNHKNLPWYRNSDLKMFLVSGLTSGFIMSISAVKGLLDGPKDFILVEEQAVDKLVNLLDGKSNPNGFNIVELYTLFRRFASTVRPVGDAVAIANIVSLLLFLKQVMRTIFMLILYRKLLYKKLQMFLLPDIDARIKSNTESEEDSLLPTKRNKGRLNDDISYNTRLKSFIVDNEWRRLTVSQLITLFNSMEEN